MCGIILIQNGHFCWYTTLFYYLNMGRCQSSTLNNIYPFVVIHKRQNCFVWCTWLDAMLSFIIAGQIEFTCFPYKEEQVITYCVHRPLASCANLSTLVHVNTAICIYYIWYWLINHQLTHSFTHTMDHVHAKFHYSQFV